MRSIRFDFADQAETCSDWKAICSVWILRVISPHQRNSGDAEAVVVVAIRRVVPIAVRRPTILGGVVPTAATVYAVRAFMDPLPPIVVTRLFGIANS
jgi:hypothetical protein